MRRARGAQDRLGMMISRGTLEKVDPKKKMYEIDVKVSRDEQHTKIEFFQGYGFKANPKKPTKKEKAEALIVYPGGDRSHAIAVTVADRRYPIELKEGEVVVHHHSGDKIHFTDDGVFVSSAKKLHFKAPNIILEGDVDLGGTGGKLVHRKGDADSAGDTAVGSATKVRAL